MLIVTAKVKVKPGKKDAFVRAAQTPIAATRKEPGNVCYLLYASTDDEDELMYYEEWRSRGDLDAHIKSGHMQMWAKMKEEMELTVGPSQVRIFQVTE